MSFDEFRDLLDSVSSSGRKNFVLVIVAYLFFYLVIPIVAVVGVSAGIGFFLGNFFLSDNLEPGINEGVIGGTIGGFLFLIFVYSLVLFDKYVDRKRQKNPGYDNVGHE